MRVTAPASECPRIPAAFLESERRTMPERYFRQEYCCEFGERDDAVFRSEDIEATIDWSIEPLFGRK
jgi:hypothetical protein